jgi:hypothetical protein
MALRLTRFLRSYLPSIEVWFRYDLFDCPKSQLSSSGLVEFRAFFAGMIGSTALQLIDVFAKMPIFLHGERREIDVLPQSCVLGQVIQHIFSCIIAFSLVGFNNEIGNLTGAWIGAAVYLFFQKFLKTESTFRQIVRIGGVHFPRENPEAREFYDVIHKGRREISVPVTFDLPFTRQPRVAVSLRKIDLGDVQANIYRISVRAENVRLSGFDLYFETWEDSQIYDAVASWIAVAE